ncbi:MAG: hypothetical protein ACRD3Q_02995 [Terriglobales bacterium]
MNARMKPRLLDPAEVELPPLAADRRYAAKFEELQRIEERIRQAERRELIARARRSGQQPTASALERAQALLGGGQISTSSPAAELGAALEERSVLQAAKLSKHAELDELRGAISGEVCARFATLHADALRAALAAATQLHQALEAGRVIRGKLIAGGYAISESQLPVHLFPDGAVLGDPERVGMTPAARFKAWLEAKGII